MPGVPLNLDLPLDGDAIAVSIPKLVEALQTIQTDVEAKVLPTEMDMTTNLDMAGNDLVAVGTVRMEEQADTSFPADTVLFFGGEFYVVTAAGAVKVTNNGLINAASIGGIGGDYGGVNPALVSFNDASKVYRFYDDFSLGAWADLEARDLILHGDLAKMTFTVDDTLAANKTVTFGATLVPAATALLMIDATGKVTTGTAIATVLQSSADITLTGTAKLNHGTWSRVFAPTVQSSVTALNQQWVKTTAGVVGGTGTSGLTYYFDFSGFDVGDTITGITFSHKGGAAGTDITSITVVQCDQAGVETDAAAAPSSKTDITTSWGTQVLTISNINIAAGESVRLKLVHNDATGNTVWGNATLTYTH